MTDQRTTDPYAIAVAQPRVVAVRPRMFNWRSPMLFRRLRIALWNLGLRSGLRCKPVRYSWTSDIHLRDLDLWRWNHGIELIRCCMRTSCKGNRVDYQYGDRGYEPSKRSTDICMACYKRDGR